MKEFAVNSPSAKVPHLGTGASNSGKIPSGRIGGSSVLTSIRSLTKEEINKIQHLINFAQEFKDRTLRISFGEFLQQLRSTSFLITVVLVFTFCFTPLSIYTFVDEWTRNGNHDGRDTARNVLSICSMVAACFASYSGWIIYFHWNPPKNIYENWCPDCLKSRIRLPTYVIHPEQDQPKRVSNQKIAFSLRSLSLKSALSFIEVKPESMFRWYGVFLFASEIYFICIFIRRAFNFHCDISDKPSFILRSFGTGICYDGAIKAQFLSFNATLVILLPMLYFISLPEVAIRLIWIIFITGVSTCIITAFYLRAFESLLMIALFVAIAVFLIKDTQLRNILIFLTQQRLREVIVENDVISHENHENEMKHLIANVAHDLKTPLSSFTTGLDLIQYILDEYEVKSSEPNETLAHVLLLKETYIKTIQACIANIRNTNSFMLMTINRAIDYTKASRGLKLVPRYETIDLWHTLQLPLSCMENIQNRIDIKLFEIPKEICSHIITDKQWLQENILCLLSNGVKYSTHGTVTIRVSLVEASSIAIPNTEFGLSTKDLMGDTGLSEIQEEPSEMSHAGSPKLTHHNSKMIKEVSRIPNSVTISKDDVAGLFQSSSTIGESNKDDNTLNGDLEAALKSSQSSSSSLSVMNSLPPGKTPTPSTINNFTTKLKKTIATPSLNTIYNRRKVKRKSDGTSASKVILFEIEDTGIGIAEEAMAALFNPFKQTQRFTGGTGLGLYSLAKRVEALNGEFGVRKRHDGTRGSLFWFTIPYRPDEFTSADASSISEESSRESNSSKSIANLRRALTMKRHSSDLTVQAFSHKTLPRIVVQDISESPHNSLRSSGIPPSPKAASLPPALISKRDTSVYLALENTLCLDILLVDDSPMILKMTGLMLKRLGHCITTADNGEVAIDLVEKRWKDKHQKFHVILMDLQMPVMDGLEATRRIRLMEKSEDVRLPPQLILGVSANSDADTTLAAYEAGVNSFMGKPFDITTFYETIAKLLH